MAKRQGESDFEIDFIGDLGPGQDAPQERTLAVTAPLSEAQVGDDNPTAEVGPVAPVAVVPAIPEGQMARFRFADGVTLEYHIPHAIGVGGGGVAEHGVPWFVLRGADRIVINEGPLQDIHSAGRVGT
jgi:hypothetical protein